MAVGQTGTTGKYLRRSASLPSTAVSSVCGWGLRRSDTDSGAPTLCAMESATASASEGYYLEMVSGVLNLTSPEGNTAFGSTPAVDTPFFWWMTNTSGAGNFKGGWATRGAAFVTASKLGRSFTPGALYLLNDSYDDTFDGIVSNIKVWEAVLTEAEFYLEMYRMLPARFTNLHLFSPLWSTGDVLDYSGNGRTWTTAGTLTDEAQPPVAWVAADAMPWKAAAGSGTSGTLAIAPDSGAVAMAGTSAVSGPLIIEGSGGAVAMAGTSNIIGDLIITGSGGTVAMAGTSNVFGDLIIAPASGAVQILGGSDSTGDLVIAGSGATLAMEGTSTDSGTLAIDGSGGVIAMEGTSNIPGTIGITGSGGTVAMAGTSNIIGDLVIAGSGATVDIRESAVVVTEDDDFFLVQ